MAKQIKKQNKWIYIGALVGIVVIAVGVFFGLRKINDHEKENTVVQTTEEKKGTEGIELAKKNTEDSTQDDEEPKVKQYEGENPNNLDSLTGVITYAGVVGNRLSIRINIDQYLAEGSCVLNLKQGGAIVRSMTAAINGAATTATCEGFDVELDGLATGNYQIEVELNSGGKTGIIKSEVTI